ncbi:MAG: 4Fe-4S binding protein, partial [Selenomonas sp.]|nr:4Fe-4S binding protein [Selenomonas sp.]
KKRHMDSYKHNIGRCMYCDLCIEACPVKALSWDKNYEGASYFKEDMTYDAVVEAKNRRGNDE